MRCTFGININADCALQSPPRQVPVTKPRVGARSFIFSLLTRVGNKVNIVMKFGFGKVFEFPFTGDLLLPIEKFIF